MAKGLACEGRLMATWSIPIQAGWKLRVLSGTSIGKEFDLRPGRYVLGSQAGADIVIPSPGIAARHVTIGIYNDYVQVDDCSGGLGMRVSGTLVPSARLRPGEPVTVGSFTFDFRNPAVAAASPPAVPPSLAGLFKLPLWARVGLLAFVVAAVLFTLLAATHTPTLVPVTLLAMSAVVPATVLCWLVPKYDTTGISFQTLTIIFLSGGTVGIISAMFGFVVKDMVLGGFLGGAIFAGIAEEPGKLLGTCWRWRHPAYDRPMDGLILGTVSGFGFAVFETAGYGFAALAKEDGGLGSLLVIMLIRGITSPFGHGLWSGILAAAFWQCGRDLRRAVRSKTFGIAFLWAVGLHGLWNASSLVRAHTLLEEIFLILAVMVPSAVLSVREYRRLLARKGYRP
jgi:RsiW-degrading membrane proteinase PrsW (M82 family)